LVEYAIGLEKRAFNEIAVTRDCQAFMADRPQIECDIHDLLDEANTLLLSAAVNVAETAGLIGKLRNCADQVRDGGLTDTAARMQADSRPPRKKIARRILRHYLPPSRTGIGSSFSRYTCCSLPAFQS